MLTACTLGPDHYSCEHKRRGDVDDALLNEVCRTLPLAAGCSSQDDHVAIDTSGDYWRGDDLADLAEYLREYRAGGYPPVTVVEFVCPQCRGLAFRVSADATEGCAQLTCLTCGTKSFAADSEDFWEDAQPEPVSCPCGGTTYAAAVGFALRPDSEVRWVSVGIRCITDGALGVCADWKISYSPTTHLVEAQATRGRP